MIRLEIYYIIDKASSSSYSIPTTVIDGRS